MAIKNNKQFFKKIKNINSISEYLDAINYLKKNLKIENHSLFFRGTSNKIWENIPSIYRGKSSLIKNEKDIYYDMISRCSDDFKHCKTVFDHLVMMQHYSVPTRLLDLSTNPLVALYFACNKTFDIKINDVSRQEDKIPADGKVNIFNVIDSEIKNYNSDTVTILASLAKIENSFNVFYLKWSITTDSMEKEELPLNESYFDLDEFIALTKKQINAIIFKQKKEINLTKDFPLKNIRKIYLSQYEEIISLIEKYEDNPPLFYPISTPKVTDESTENLKEIIRKVKHIQSNYMKDSLYKKNYLRFIHIIQEEKPYFNPDYINLRDIESVICVEPKLNNPHIIRQSGAFFLFGLEINSTNKNNCAKIPERYKPKIDGKDVTFIIPANKKDDILKELESLSISEGNLFTDIDKVAKDIKKKYF